MVPRFVTHEPLVLSKRIQLAELAAIAEGERELQLDAASQTRLRNSAAALSRQLAAGAPIYGITTGYGPLAEYPIEPKQRQALQRKLVYHLCAGVGPPLARREARAIMAARAVNLAQGWSGVDPAVVEQLLHMLARDVIPVVPEQGTVGASGDLTPLAHIALAAMGEGEVLTAAGTPQPASTALAQAGLSPLSLGGKDGLALVNGTAAMTGIAALNAVTARRAIDRLIQLTVCHGELARTYAAAWQPRLAQAKPHRGQREAARRLAAASQDSHRLRAATTPPGHAHRQAPFAGMAPAAAPQDPYTLRCAPQEIGAALDVLAFHDRLVEDELNAASDNPLVDPDDGTIWHGGNFYGQPVAYAADSLMLALVKLAGFAERAIARIVDPKLNGGLPYFLSGGQPGLDSGFMGAQVTATALLAELRTLATPAAIQSLPTNANNQDVVTLGTIAARRCRDLLVLCWRLLAIEALLLVQGMDLVMRDGESLTAFADSSQRLYAEVRETVPFLAGDRPLSREIEHLAVLLQNGSAQPPSAG